jgi:hypothetical protein
MKKLSLLLLSFALYASVWAQNNFPTSNAIWNYSVSASDLFSSQNGTKNIYYTICGDTVIDGNVYYKLYTTLDTVLCGDNLKYFLGLFRQDGQKVYFTPYHRLNYPYSDYLGTEHLLYDFGVSIGDTVHIDYGFRYYFWQDNYGRQGDYHSFTEYEPIDKQLIVSNIEMGEDGMKKIYLESTGEYGYEYDIWYEGMGSPLGLFRSGEMHGVLDGYDFGFSLKCFKHNDIVKYVDNSDCNKCFCQNYVNIQENTINKIKIYPNPTIGELRVSGDKLHLDCIEIFDVYGRKQESRKRKAEDGMVLDISPLQSGIYFLKIDNQIVKIIKN